MKHRVLLFALLSALYLACGSESDPGLSQPTRCVAGKVEPCACPGTTVQGTQTCQADGSYSTCAGCSSGAGGAAGAGGASGAGGSGFLGGAAGSGASGQGGTGNAGGVAGTGGDGGAGPGGAGGAGPAGAGGSDPAGAGGAGPAGAGGTGGTAGAAGTAGTAGSGGNDDKDKDGWTVAAGDCNDQNPNINPGAAELIELDAQGKPAAQQIDNDCDGKAAKAGEEATCDAGLGVVVNDPFDAAKAMGLCQVKVTESSKKWGVIAAGFNDISTPFLSGGIKATGKGLEHAFGILPDLGQTSGPREGQRIFALSSGMARAPGQPGWGEVQQCQYSKNYTSGQPIGFPKTGTCVTPGQPNDGVALDLQIRVPTNARSLRFKHRFFSCEYPEYTCDQFNDVFAVMMSPSPLSSGDPMADGQNLSANIAFELTSSGIKNVIGVNNESFLSACEPGAKTGKYPNCKAGNGAQLTGSGFEGHAGSSWLVTQANVPPGGIIYLRFAIWDSTDGAFDSTSIIDDFEWSTEPVNGATTFVDESGGSGQGGSSGSGGAGGAGGSAGAGGGGIFGGSGGAPGGSSGAGGSDIFGGSSGSGGSSTAGSNSGGTSSGGTGGSGTVGPCPDGSCAAAGQCCLDPATSQCGTDFSGILCL